MAKRHNWADLRTEFITGNFLTLAEFAKYKNISYKTLYERAYKEHWLKEKAGIKQEIHSKSTEAIISDIKEKSVIVNRRHIEIADKALEVIGEEIGRQARKSSINPFAFEKLITTFEKCQKIHRVALGMDKDGGGSQEDRVASLFEQMKEVFKDEPSGIE